MPYPYDDDDTPGAPQVTPQAPSKAAPTMPAAAPVAPAPNRRDYGGGFQNFRRYANDVQGWGQREQTRRSAPASGGSTPTTWGGWNPNGPAGQVGYNGKSDLSATNGFNQANIWKMTYDAMRQTGDDWQQGRQRASDSRGRADAQAGSYQMPSYQAPADFQYAGWQQTAQAPNPGSYSWGAWNGQRPPQATDEEFGNSVTRYGQIMASQGGGPVQARDAEATDTGGFGGAFYDYANAGANILQTKMKDQHRTLTDNAAGRGRLNTGFFDEDTGNLWRQLGSEAQDSINSRALDAARLDMEPAMQNARLRTQVSEGNADRNLQGQRYAQDDRQYLMDFASGREDARGSRADRAYEFDRGAYEDDRNFGYGVYGDERDYNRRAYEADRGFERGAFENDRDFARTGYDTDRAFGRGTFENDRAFGRGTFESDRDYNEDRYRFDENMWRGDRDSYLDQVAGARDWREGQTQQEKAEQAQGSFWSNLAKGALGTVAGAALGPVGAAAGNYVASKIGGGGGGGGADPYAYMRRATGRGGY